MELRTRNLIMTKTRIRNLMQLMILSPVKVQMWKINHLNLKYQALRVMIVIHQGQEIGREMQRRKIKLNLKRLIISQKRKKFMRLMTEKESIILCRLMTK